MRTSTGPRWVKNASGMSRRRLMAAGVSLSVTGLLPVTQVAGRDNDGVTERGYQNFMTVSRRLTDRDELHPLIGHAVYDTLLSVNKIRGHEIDVLADLAKHGNFSSASAFARAAEQSNASLKETIHDILHGWYRGVVGETVVVFRSAMMFAITQDAVFPKTYAAARPFYWTERPPSVDLPHGAPVLTPSAYQPESQ